METTTLHEDIIAYGIRAASFPDGIKQAHQQLHALVPFDQQRSYFGFSWPYDDGIIYLAATTAMQPDELSHLSLEKKVMKKGDYLYIDIQAYMQQPGAIGEAFQQLIHDDRIDPQGFCIEWYISRDVCRCMVRLR